MMRWAIIAFCLLIASAVTFFIMRTPAQVSSRVEPDNSRCLKETEKAIYEVLEAGRPGKVRISVIDTVASSTVWSKEFAMHSTTQVHPYELHNCHFYLHRAENYDYENSKATRGFLWELRRYDYFSDSSGEQIVAFSKNESGDTGQRMNLYGTSFMIDRSENYISLERSSLGKPDYALVIKNIETGEDEYVLTLADVMKEHPNAVGSFDVGAWVTRPDGVYLSTIIYDGSRWAAYIYIKKDTWETEIYETPSDYLPGVERSAPTFAPLLAYTDVIVWAGFDTVTDAIMDEQIASGKMKKLIVADLKTGERTVVAEVPIVKEHRFKLTWRSDSELQYTMPDGEVRTYRQQ